MIIPDRAPVTRSTVHTVNHRRRYLRVLDEHGVLGHVEHFPDVWTSCRCSKLFSPSSSEMAASSCWTGPVLHTVADAAVFSGSCPLCTWLLGATATLTDSNGTTGKQCAAPKMLPHDVFSRSGFPASTHDITCKLGWRATLLSFSMTLSAVSATFIRRCASRTGILISSANKAFMTCSASHACTKSTSERRRSRDRR